MRTCRSLLFTALIVAALAANAAAQTAPSMPVAARGALLASAQQGPGGSAAAPGNVRSRVGLYFKVSSLGYGIDVATPISDKLNVRGGFTYFGFSRDFDDDGITIDATGKLRSVSASLDWFPFSGAFHISPGVLVYNGVGIDATAKVPPNRVFSLSDTDYVSNPANPVTGTLTMSFPKVAPSITFGWGNIMRRGGRHWTIPVELGVAFTRSPAVALNLTGSACAVNGSNCRAISTDPTLQRDLRDQEAQINDDLSVLKLYPMLSVGFSWRFGDN